MSIYSKGVSVGGRRRAEEVRLLGKDYKDKSLMSPDTAWGT